MYYRLWLGSGIRPPRTIPLGPYFAFMVEPLTPNDLDKREIYLDHRKLAAQRLVILCIGYLNHEQLSQLDRELRTILKNPPEPDVRQKRGRGL